MQMPSAKAALSTASRCAFALCVVWGSTEALIFQALSGPARSGLRGRNFQPRVCAHDRLLETVPVAPQLDGVRLRLFLQLVRTQAGPPSVAARCEDMRRQQVRHLEASPRIAHACLARAGPDEPLGVAVRLEVHRQVDGGRSAPLIRFAMLRGELFPPPLETVDHTRRFW